MKKIIAFISSLLLVAPAFGQDNAGGKDKKPQGVSKVKQENVKPAPAAAPNAKPGTEQKNAGNVKHSGEKSKKSSGTNTGTTAPK
jgi:hypothetical protein